MHETQDRKLQDVGYGPPSQERRSRPPHFFGIFLPLYASFPPGRPGYKNFICLSPQGDGVQRLSFQCQLYYLSIIKKITGLAKSRFCHL